MPHWSRRGFLAAATALLLAGAAACGSESTTTNAAFEPLTIEHTYGATQIPDAPQTVVSISGAWTDALLSLDVPIAAVFGYEGYSGPGGRFPWTPDHDAEITEYTDIGAQLERIAAYEPDLILAGYLPDEQTYKALSAVAPTIAVMDPDAVLDTWQDTTLAAGRIFGKQAQAQALVDGVTAQIAEFRAAYPGAAGKTFSYGQFTGEQYGLVASATDPAAQLLTDLGLTMDPRAVAEAAGAERVLVSLEKVDVLAADVLLMWPLGAPEDLDPLPGWKDLPAVRNGTLLLVDDVTATAFALPSVTSVPYALDLIRPVFERLG